MTLGARRSRVLGAIWILAGLGLLAGAVLLWVDRQTVSVWELPLAAVALGVGAWLWSQRVTIDRHGITVSSLTGTECTLWASIDAVEVQATWWRPALTIHRMGNESRTSVRTSSGLTSSQRARLFDVLHELSRDHGFTIRRSGAPDVASAADLPAGSAAAGLALIETESRSTGDGTPPQPDDGAPDDSTPVDDAAVEDPSVDDARGEEPLGDQGPGEEDDPRANEDAAGEDTDSPASEDDAGSDDTEDPGSATDVAAGDANTEAAPTAPAAAPDEDADAATPAISDAAPDGLDPDAPDGLDPDATDVIEVIVEPAAHETPTAPPAS